MKSKHLKQVLLIGLTIVIILLGIRLNHQEEPYYKEKPLSYWVQKINRNGFWLNTNQGVIAIRAMGTNALPGLLTFLNHKESSFKTTLHHSILRYTGWSVPVLEDQHLVAKTIYAFRALRRDADPAIPALVDMVENEIWSAGEVLINIGPAASRELIQACKSKNRNVRMTCVGILANYQHRHALSIPQKTGIEQSPWRISTGSENPYLSTTNRWMNHQTVGLLQLLLHPNPAVRRASADALSVGNNFMQERESALRSATRDDDTLVRMTAHDAITRLNMDTNDMLNPFLNSFLLK